MIEYGRKRKIMMVDEDGEDGTEMKGKGNDDGEDGMEMQ